jgi:hypothetical protein
MEHGRYLRLALSRAAEKIQPICAYQQVRRLRSPSRSGRNPEVTGRPLYTARPVRSSIAHWRAPRRCRTGRECGVTRLHGSLPCTAVAPWNNGTGAPYLVSAHPIASLPEMPRRETPGAEFASTIMATGNATNRSHGNGTERKERTLHIISARGRESSDSEGASAAARSAGLLQVRLIDKLASARASRVRKR